MLRFFTLLCAFFVCGNLHAQLVVIQESDPVKLSRNLVGTGVYISNATLNASPFAAGFFYNRGGTLIGIDSGIVLSSGRIVTAAGNNGMNAPQSASASGTLLTPG